MPSRLKSVVTNKSCAGGTLSRAQSSPMPNAARLLAPLAAARRMRAISAFSRSGTDANIDEDLLPAQAAQFQQPRKLFAARVVRATWAMVRSSIERWQFEFRLVLSAGSTHQVRSGSRRTSHQSHRVVTGPTDHASAPGLGNPKKALPPLTWRNLLCYRCQAVFKDLWPN